MELNAFKGPSTKVYQYLAMAGFTTSVQQLPVIN